jgi:hypothetical protein
MDCVLRVDCVALDGLKVQQHLLRAVLADGAALQ